MPNNNDHFAKPSASSEKDQYLSGLLAVQPDGFGALLEEERREKGSQHHAEKTPMLEG